MNILILGATGFVGNKIASLLLEGGFHLVCAGRNLEVIKQQFPEVQSLYCDFIHDISIDDWLPRLEGIDIIINCAGIFFHQDKKIIWDIHFNAPKALYQAAQYKKVQQIIHLSALGIDNYSNEYATSKKAIEDFLRPSPIPHIILRPSLIYGSRAKGGVNLMKKIASLPLFIPLPDKGAQRFQPIYVNDLAHAIKNLILTPPVTTSLTLAAVSDEKIQLKEILLIIRNWLKLPRGFFIKIPYPVLKIIAWFGNKWSSSIVNTQAIDMLKQGNYTTTEDASLFQEVTGVIPRNFKSGLNVHPALKEERWSIRLVWIRPFLKLSLAIMWLFSAITSVLPYAKSSSYMLIQQIGLPSSSQPIILYGACLLNAFIGFSLLLNYKIKLNCILQLGVILLYSLIITFYLPYLWLEPFGPVVKNIPILVSIFVLYILES